MIFDCRSKTEWISIHALVKRATLKLRLLDGLTYISIHALVKRATWRRKEG